MKIEMVNSSIEQFCDVASSFVRQFSMPKDWFNRPDHIAIKCAGEIDYLETSDELLGFTDSGLWEIEIDERMIASGQLLSGVELGLFEDSVDKTFNWIEIMQPRPGKESEKGFVEHCEFTYPDFFAIERWLNSRGIGYELQKNEGHSWINIMVDNKGREIKINDIGLSEVITVEKSRGLLRQIRGNE